MFEYFFNRFKGQGQVDDRQKGGGDFQKPCLQEVCDLADDSRAWIYDDELWMGNKPSEHLTGSAELEQRAATNVAMVNFKLANAMLEGIDLVNHGSAQGYDLIHSDLYRANLRNAHLFALNLSGSSLMKADFRGANLHFAKLENCNLLGARFEGAKLDHVDWGSAVLQENLGREALKLQEYDKADDYISQAEEVYRMLRLQLERSGLFEMAGVFFHKEMVMRRLQIPLWSLRRLMSKIVDVFSGYGEKPGRVVGFSITIMLSCAVLYYLLGIQSQQGSLGFSTEISLWENIEHFFSCVYFSIVTFTTLGYGDIIPTGWVRPLAAFEAFMGSFTMALFVVVFVKKMTR